MKVEKCPRCKQIPVFRQSQYSDVTPQTVIECECEKELYWGSVLWAKLYFNRWARREARRIAKEGATK